VACTNCEEVEVFLNGKSQGRQPRNKYELNTWHIAYAPGKLSAIGYEDGKAVSRISVETTTDPVALVAIPERASLAGDGVDVMTFRIEAQDAKGRFTQFAQQQVTFDVANGEIIGVGNGNSNSAESEKGNTRALFNGLAQVIVRSVENSNGYLSLTASAPVLRSAYVIVKIVPTAPWPYQDISGPVQPVPVLSTAPIVGTEPISVPQNLSSLQTELWGRINAGVANDALGQDGFVVSVARWVPYARVQKQGGIIRFSSVRGAAKAYIDGILVGQKTDPRDAPFEIKLPAKLGERNLALVFKVTANETFGLPDLAWISST